MKLSIIIATHNRASLLLNAIDALVPQTRGQAVEVIVVDSASDEAEKNIVEHHINGLIQNGHSNVTYYALSTPGVSKARNKGVHHAKGTWIATLDDDTVPSAQWVQGAFAAIAATPDDSAIIQGRIDPQWPSVESPNVGPRWQRFLSIVQFNRDFEFTDDDVCAGANMLVRAAALNEVGGYDENFGRVGKNLASGIDSALTAAIRRRGYRIFYSNRFPVDHVIHQDRLTEVWLARRSQMDGHAVGKVLFREARWDRLAYQLTKSLVSVGVFSALLAFHPSSQDYRIRRDVNRGVLAQFFGRDTAS